jgi:hypothetical protein
MTSVRSVLLVEIVSRSEFIQLTVPPVVLESRLILELAFHPTKSVVKSETRPKGNLRREPNFGSSSSP